MKKAENTGNYIDISFSNKRNNVFLLLLYKSYYLNLVTFAVAPPVGAWIEIEPSGIYPSLGLSLPPWERGLKSPRLIHLHNPFPSLPPWERGLKYALLLF